MNRAYNDTSMELHRAINPDWRFADPTPYLLAEIATIESSRRYFQLLQTLGEEVPREYWPATYGPPRDEPEQQVVDTTATETARSIAADLRAELVA